MPLLDHFGIIAPFYDAIMSQRQEDRLVGLLGLPTPGLLLDAGGGTGRVAQALRVRAGGCVVADESGAMLRQAQRKPGLWLAQSVTERLPFAEDTFDCILMVDALHHVADQAATVQEMWRVCKPGGRIVIEEPNIHHWAAKLIAVGEKLLLMRSHFRAPAHIQALFPGRTQALLENGSAWITCVKER